MAQQGSSGEKTEKATPKRKREAREKGQVFKSTELIAAFSLVMMLGALSIFAKEIIENIQGMMVVFFSGTIPETVNAVSASVALNNAIVRYILIMLPIFGAALLAAVAFNLAQVGFIFTSKTIQPKFEKISMISGFKRLFSIKSVVEFLKALLKIAIIAGVAYGQYKKHIGEFPALMSTDITTAVVAFTKIILAIAFRVVIAFALLVPFDYLYQWWKHDKDMKMTKQEVKDEYKLVEGNPQVKSRISQKQRQMARMRMIQAVQNADVVITNPTHYAVALSYDEEESIAPLVIAKGKNYIAMRIKEEAKEWDISIVENKPLAQSLFFFCEVGDEVPEEMYKAVAEVLAYVYNLGKRRR